MTRGLTRDRPDRCDQAAHAVSPEKPRFLRLPSNGTVREHVQVAKVLIEGANETAWAVRPAVTAEIHRVHRVSSMCESLRRCGIAPTVLGKTVNENQSGFRLAVGQPDLLVQAHAIAVDEKVFVMGHEEDLLELRDPCQHYTFGGRGRAKNAAEWAANLVTLHVSPV